MIEFHRSKYVRFFYSESVLNILYDVTDVSFVMCWFKDNFKIREQQLIEFTSRECENAAKLERHTLQQMYEERLAHIQHL